MTCLVQMYIHLILAFQVHVHVVHQSPVMLTFKTSQQQKSLIYLHLMKRSINSFSFLHFSTGMYIFLPTHNYEHHNYKTDGQHNRDRGTCNNGNIVLLIASTTSSIAKWYFFYKKQTFFFHKTNLLYMYMFHTKKYHENQFV